MRLKNYSYNYKISKLTFQNCNYNCERSELPSLSNCPRCLYIIIYKYKKTFKNEQRNRDDTAKKSVNTSGVGESNNYCEDIYSIYTSLQQHSLNTPIDSTH